MWFSLKFFIQLLKLLHSFILFLPSGGRLQLFTLKPLNFPKTNTKTKYQTAYFLAFPPHHNGYLFLKIPQLLIHNIRIYLHVGICYNFPNPFIQNFHDNHIHISQILNKVGLGSNNKQLQAKVIGNWDG